MSTITATATNTTNETASKQDWYSPECLKEMRQDFELILTFSHDEAIEGLTALRQAYNREAMAVAARQLSQTAKKRLYDLVAASKT